LCSLSREFKLIVPNYDKYDKFALEGTLNCVPKHEMLKKLTFQRAEKHFTWLKRPSHQEAT
jgi:hypothetical protein